MSEAFDLEAFKDLLDTPQGWYRDHHLYKMAKQAAVEIERLRRLRLTLSENSTLPESEIKGV